MDAACSDIESGKYTIATFTYVFDYYIIMEAAWPADTH
jgi:hypothetical protein